MKTYTSAKAVLEEIYPLHRTLVSDGLDQSLQIVGEYMPADSQLPDRGIPARRKSLDLDHPRTICRKESISSKLNPAKRWSISRIILYTC